MVTVAIVMILAATALVYLKPTKRLEVKSMGAEIAALLHAARLSALASGKDTIVMFFPNAAAGRLVEYEDGPGTLFSGGPPDFTTYNPASPGIGANCQLLSTLELPRGVALGVPSGVVLPLPLQGIDVTVDCSFCNGGGDRRGAIRFDPRGRAWFYPANGSPQVGVPGGSITLRATSENATDTVVVTSRGTIYHPSGS